MWKLYVASEQPMLSDTSSLTSIGYGDWSLAENLQMAPLPVTTFQNQALRCPTSWRPISFHFPADRSYAATVTVATGVPPPLAEPRTAVRVVRTSLPKVVTAICDVPVDDAGCGDA